MCLTGADQAAADIARVRDVIAAIAEPARRAQAKVRRMAEAFNLITPSARKAAECATATVERMNGVIAAETRDTADLAEPRAAVDDRRRPDGCDDA